MDNPTANPVVVLREKFDDWAVLFNPDTAEAVGINPTGVMVWKLLNGRRNVEEIVRRVQDHYSQVPDRAAEDVRDFIQSLAERGFVGYEHGGVRP
jgi:SynChlorMet cassette protein ScmD